QWPGNGGTHRACSASRPQVQRARHLGAEPFHGVRGAFGPWHGESPANTRAAKDSIGTSMPQGSRQEEQRSAQLSTLKPLDLELARGGLQVKANRWRAELFFSSSFDGCCTE